jgi:hypothetical protein
LASAALVPKPLQMLSAETPACDAIAVIVVARTPSRSNRSRAACMNTRISFEPSTEPASVAVRSIHAMANGDRADFDP